jgi:hypothetical protein
VGKRVRLRRKRIKRALHLEVSEDRPESLAVLHKQVKSGQCISDRDPADAEQGRHRRHLYVGRC